MLMKSDHTNYLISRSYRKKVIDLTSTVHPSLKKITSLTIIKATNFIYISFIGQYLADLPLQQQQGQVEMGRWRKRSEVLPVAAAFQPDLSSFRFLWGHPTCCPLVAVLQTCIYDTLHCFHYPVAVFVFT